MDRGINCSTSTCFYALRLSNIKFVIVTLGKDGCIMLGESVDGPSMEEVDVDSLLESLELRKNKSVSIPTCISSVVNETWNYFFSDVVLLKPDTKLILLG
ncbi:hypothetical protein SESBI_00615 [Sesbania bispinosa]|nr:hypothetical protein SESBI_00615 [Sesbania bispinosa]